VWPTEPAKAGWSFNKWQKTKILKGLPQHRQPSNRRRNGRGPAAVRAVAAAPADAAVVAVAAEVGRVPVADVARLVVDRAAVVLAAKAADVAARVAADGVRAKAGTATAAVAMVEASSSRT
jgi:hypothetical protein